MNPARKEAFLSLTKSLKDKKYSNLEMNVTLEKDNLSSEDRSLYTRLYLGVLELNYLAFSIISTTRHLFVFERGLVSIISTLSPIPHSFFSSCA